MKEGTAARYWEEHLATLAAHERSLFALQEHRAQILAGLCGSIVAGSVAWLSTIHWWEQASFVSEVLVAGGLLGILLAAAVFWLTLTPMEGRRFRRRSLAERAYSLTRALQGGSLLSGRFLPSTTVSRQARRLAEDLAADARQATDTDGLGATDLALSPTARARLADWLKDTVRTDLGWWLDGQPDQPEERRQMEARIRMVFWFWANRQVSEAKAEMVRTGISIATWAVLLLALAGVVNLLGWWLLLLLLAVVGAWFARYILIQRDL